MLPPTSPIARKLRGWQAQLLDLSRLNRLLYFKLERASSVPIAQPAPEDLFQTLVVRGKALTFPLLDELTLIDLDQVEEGTPPEATASKDVTSSPENTTLESAAPDQPAPPDRPAPRPRKRAASEITSSLSDERLARALFNLRARARAALEEQGVNVLFVAFGLLHWIDPPTKDNVTSPLVLVPVTLTREALRKPYTLSMFEDDVVLNPTLLYKLRADFGLDLPDVPDDLETQGLTAYLNQLRQAIAARSGWSISDEAILGVFSFQKINLYQDMAEHEALFAQHPLIAALSGVGTLPLPPALIAANELDERVPPMQVFQVVDADSSQQEAIQAAKQGASFVLQGPPGTGKSQTITNIIAESLASGKRVLFVSQKMAALEVVQRRLNEAGLGEFCLQLHSHKRDKREVIKELVDALNAPEVAIKPEYEAPLLEVQTARAKLNAYAKALHVPRFALHQTVFYAHGELARLTDAARLQNATHLQPVGAPLPFDVGDVISVGTAELAQRVDLLNRLAALPAVIDRYADHPWRGATARSISFGLRDQLARSLDELIKVVPPLIDQIAALAQACTLPQPRTFEAARPLLAFLQEVEPRLFALDLEALHARFTTKYTSIVRGLMGDFRADMQALSGVRLAKDKLSYEQALAVIERALEIRGDLTPSSTLPRSAGTGEGSGVGAVLAALDRATPPLTEVFGRNIVDAIDLAQLPQWLAQQRPAISQLDDYAAFNRLCDEAPALKLNAFIDAALAAQLPAARWRDTYLFAFWQALVDAATQSDEALRTFDSRAHTTLIDRFKELDRQQLIIGRARIRALLSERRPKSTWIQAATAEQGILRREAAKKRRIKPLRKLFAEIPRLITELKPCLLMSPITVSLLLDPNVYHFDLVVFDEASQIAPEEAAGAILRSTQTIIVGDKQQLPPTRFFAVVGGETDDDGDDEDGGRLFDSILEESEGLSLPQKMLLWHYRSRDESLIAFSNHHFYHDRLYTFPNVEFDSGKLGLDFVYVAEGVYKRGHNLRRNDLEAKRVVELIFAHAEKSPERTLGVIAFSIAQRDAIQLELDRRRREQPQFEAYFDEDNAEPFFIKNLEMVQGDERDAIIFSVGYAKDESGKLIYNFGPLNQAGGERRLNVAVSRARYHVTLVASLQPEDIDLTRTTSNGAKLLKDYMLIARDGLASLRPERTLSEQRESKRQSMDAQTGDSAFEDEVYQALTTLIPSPSPKGEGSGSLTLHRRVGVSGYRIDLAVVDPDQPGRYLLGIECDGATYQSAQTARDRDRLRQQVLEGLGWKLLRIWSRDWIADRAREIDRVVAMIRSLKQTSVPPESANPIGPAAPTANVETLLTPPPQPEVKVDLPTYVWPYKRAKLVSFGAELGQAAPAALAVDVVRVVKLEGPVHVDEVFERIMDAWGVTRAGRRISMVLTQAIDLAVQGGQIDQRGDYLWPLGLEKPIVRAPDEGDEPRPIEHIAPEEIAEAALLCIGEARSLALADVARETAQLLGFARNGPKIDEALQVAIEALHAGGRIVIEGEVARLA